MLNSVYLFRKSTHGQRQIEIIAREQLSQDVFALASGRRNRQAVGNRLAVVMEEEETDYR